ncbi:unnamed protein product, partial [Amoebophrya sp. A25]
ETGESTEQTNTEWEPHDYAHFVSEMEMNVFASLNFGRFQVGSFFKHAAKAVQDMHNLGWTHGDINPENFLFADAAASSNQHLLVLADFGNALPVGQRRGRQNAGTIAYLDPGLIETEDASVDAVAADCWSLGATFYTVAVHCWDREDGRARSPHSKTKRLLRRAKNWPRVMKYA